jgi:PmbA protein
MMTNQLADLTEALLVAARTAGADAADAMAMSGAALSVDIRKGKLEQAERAEGIEIGLRVLIGGQQACVSASDISARTISELAARAVAMAREAPADPYAGLADAGQLAKSWDLAALDLHEDAPETQADELQDMARSVESAAMDVGGITQVEASASHSRRAVHLAASNGFSGGYARSSTSVSAVAFTGQGTAMERDYAGEGRIYRADLPDLPAIGTLAATRALARAGARKPATGTFPVLFDERVASSLIGHLLMAINGAAIARGASWALDLLGKQVLPAQLSLIEDPLRPRISGSRPFDGEGLPSRRRMVVQDGVLMGWTLDLASARKLGMQSTGSAARGTSAPPSPSSSNIDLTQGAKSQAELLADMGTGLLITSMIGSTINPTTGDYSRGAAGFWVEGGQIQYPVNECTIAGNLRDMLGRIIPANDARAHLSTRVPSLLVDGMVIAGA